MELSNAQRQAKYRENQKQGEKNRRLNAWIDAKSMKSLETLAKVRIPAQRDRPFQQYDRSFQIDRDR